MRCSRPSIKAVSVRCSTEDEDDSHDDDGVAYIENRRKSTEGDANGDPATEDVSAELVHEHAHGSGDPRIEDADDQGDGTIPMDGISDVGSYEQRASYERDAVRLSVAGFSAVNAPSGRLSTQTADHSSPYTSTANNVTRHDATASHCQPATKARPQQLQWAGEQSTMFGFDVLYSFYSFLDAKNLQNVLPQDVSYLEMQGCFRVPTKPTLDEFVKQYFLHIHPILPVINEGDFWDLYGPSPAEGSHHTKLSLLLFQAMLFAACAVRHFLIIRPCCWTC